MNHLPFPPAWRTQQPTSPKWEILDSILALVLGASIGTVLYFGAINAF